MTINNSFDPLGIGSFYTGLFDTVSQSIEEANKTERFKVAKETEQVNSQQETFTTLGTSAERMTLGLAKVQKQLAKIQSQNEKELEFEKLKAKQEGLNQKLAFNLMQDKIQQQQRNATYDRLSKSTNDAYVNKVIAFERALQEGNQRKTKQLNNQAGEHETRINQQEIGRITKEFNPNDFNDVASNFSRVKYPNFDTTVDVEKTKAVAGAIGGVSNTALLVGGAVVLGAILLD